MNRKNLVRFVCEKRSKFKVAREVCRNNQREGSGEGEESEGRIVSGKEAMRVW